MTAPPEATWPKHLAHESRSVELAARVSERLHVPTDCRDLARLVARFHGVVHRAAELRPSEATLAALDKAFKPGVTQGERYAAPMMARLGL